MRNPAPRAVRLKASLRSVPHTVFAKSIAKFFFFSSLRLHFLLRSTLLHRHDKRKVNFHSDYQVYVIGKSE